MYLIYASSLSKILLEGLNLDEIVITYALSYTIHHESLHRIVYLNLREIFEK